ncbi:relaxase/mobilization nuclease domain-containing protein [Paraflavitalea sp. CAU 1676]|uniref:relaxase/mobilization nuclease domain-containing protein n=1 Tax=Paraflavitalea sp. CAU 1676 TaxID=3032598 RepID=UPI0023DB56BE|nr:relaxase/mobilization nuclease domain-containing protein [Paraflavitalea sp. CAU 1676]MDF2190549.1 relaxase/mobilization nuclease domain-containing protein [Paraflavitalea sp. CAU 1676]
MVVRIKSGKSVRGVLSYNEKKVSAGKAELILASRFACDLSDLGFSEKLARFERLNSFNPKVKTNTLHLSLNFSPYDKIDSEKMQMVAWDYMQRIGFGNQPYLVYKHEDANHPHIHIVTTTIRPDGSPINLHNIGKQLSEPARKAIEMEFDLIPAESMKNSKTLPIDSNAGTKQRISTIVREVVNSYHFSSLDELNYILKQYNITADPGRPDSRIRNNHGLIYSDIDKHGTRTGVAIKASSIYDRPTLKTLEKKFFKEKDKKHLYTSHSIKTINSFLSTKKTISLSEMQEWFEKKRIDIDFIRNTNGGIEDLLIVDNVKKVVLSGKEINITVNQVIAKLHAIADIEQTKTKSSINGNKEQQGNTQAATSPSVLELLNKLLASDYDPTAQLPEFIKKKRKKKRKKP